MGASAGGYLAAMVTLTAAEPAFSNPYPDAFADVSAAVSVVVPMAALFDLPARWRQDRVRRPPHEQMVEIFLGGTPMNERRRFHEASPLYHVSQSNVRGTKWLIAWGTEDEVSRPVEHSLALANELRLAGALVRLAPLVGAPHFWDMDSEVEEPGSYNGQLAARLLGFLRTWCGW
jgi:acetyl esterase/lipase